MGHLDKLDIYFWESYLVCYFDIMQIKSSLRPG